MSEYSEIVKDTLHLREDLENYLKKYGEKALITVIGEVKATGYQNDTKLNMGVEEKSEEYPSEIIEKPATTNKTEEEKPNVFEVNGVNSSIYSQQPEILSKVADDITSNSVGNSSHYTRTLTKPGVPTLKMEEKPNIWASAETRRPGETDYSSLR